MTPEERKVLDDKIVAIDKQIKLLQSSMKKLEQFEQDEINALEQFKIEQNRILTEYEQQSLLRAKQALLNIPPPPIPIPFWIF